MGIFSRFADIVNSNINSLLERAEDPEKMVRLIIQEMEDTLVEVRSSSARTLAEKKDLERRLDRLKADAADWESRATLAIQKDREDLAKAALLEKQKVNDVVSAMQQEMAIVDENLDKLKSELELLQNKLQDAKARQHAMAMRRDTAASRLQVKKQLDSDKVQDAMQRFDRYEIRVDTLEAEVESYEMGKSKSLAEEIADLEAEEKINSELEALKQRVQSEKE